MTGFKLVQKKPVPDQPQQPAPPKKNESEKPKTSTAKELLNQKGSKYLEDCVICRNDVKVTISQSTLLTPEKQKETASPKTEPIPKQEAKESATDIKNKSDHLKAETKAEKLIPKNSEKILARENISNTNNNPPQKISIFSEKVSSQNQSDHSVVSNKISENKTVSPITIVTTQNANPESKAGLQNVSAPVQGLPTNSSQAPSVPQAVLINPTPQINVIPQIVPTLNTILLVLQPTTFSLSNKPNLSLGKISEAKSFGDFLLIKNNKQKLAESEKIQFSTPLISTKVLAQILANKDQGSLNTIKALLHLFGRELEEEIDQTDLEGSYGLWKEYLKKIKRKKSKQALNKNKQEKTQSSEFEELGIRS